MLKTSVSLALYCHSIALVDVLPSEAKLIMDDILPVKTSKVVKPTSL